MYKINGIANSINRANKPFDKIIVLPIPAILNEPRSVLVKTASG